MNDKLLDIKLKLIEIVNRVGRSPEDVIAEVKLYYNFITTDLLDTNKDKLKKDKK